MNQDRQTKPRKPLLVNLAWAMALYLLLFSAYLLSYAPVYRRAFGPDPGFSFPPFSPVQQQTSPVFRPVEWLIDNTPLDGVLIKCAELWGVSRGTQIDSNLRNGWQLEVRVNDSRRSTRVVSAP